MASTSLHNIEQKSRLYGSIGSFAVCLVLFLFLFFSYIPSIILPLNEGILVSFGDSFDGGGSDGDYGGTAGGDLNEGAYATPRGETKPADVTPAKQTPVKGPQEAIATQDEPSDAYVEAQEVAAREVRAQQERERIQREQEAARQLAIAEQKRREQEAIDRANRLGSAFSGGTESNQGSGTGHGSSTGTGSATGSGSGDGSGTGTGVGDGDGSGRQGNPVGRGNPNGSWSLTGRELLGSLVPPSYTNNVEGRVTVIIHVDASGSVRDALIGSPTTISDRETLNAATTAAKKTRFSRGSGIAEGTITYNFRLR